MSGPAPAFSPPTILNTSPIVDISPPITTPSVELTATPKPPLIASTIEPEPDNTMTYIYIAAGVIGGGILIYFIYNTFIKTKSLKYSNSYDSSDSSSYSSSD
jgi:hypothetical protein